MIRYLPPPALRHNGDAPGSLGGTNRAMGGTNGELSGTSGARLANPDWRLATLGAVLIGIVVATINATSRLIEAAQDGVPLDARAPWVWEVSSMIGVVALTPLIGLAYTRMPWPRDPTPRAVAGFAALHALGAMVFSAAHIAIMVVLRKLAYASAGLVYDFANGRLALTLFYEWRKDIFTYALILFSYWWLAERRRAREAASAPAARLEVKEGGRTTYLDPAEIAWVEAAGNYVELHANGRTHLARAALSAIEARLAGRGFARIHRSRLVNRARIRAVKATPAGDFEITLDDGQTLVGSRRYRAAIEGTPTL